MTYDAQTIRDAIDMMDDDPQARSALRLALKKIKTEEE